MTSWRAHNELWFNRIFINLTVIFSAVTLPISAKTIHNSLRENWGLQSSFIIKLNAFSLTAHIIVYPVAIYYMIKSFRLRTIATVASIRCYEIRHRWYSASGGLSSFTLGKRPYGFFKGQHIILGCKSTPSVLITSFE